MRVDELSSQKAVNRIIYVGDSGKVMSRLRSNHCRGNVEASALRKYVAEAMGYKLRLRNGPPINQEEFESIFRIRKKAKLKFPIIFNRVSGDMCFVIRLRKLKIFNGT